MRVLAAAGACGVVRSGSRTAAHGAFVSVISTTESEENVGERDERSKGEKKKSQAAGNRRRDRRAKQNVNVAVVDPRLTRAS